MNRSECQALDEQLLAKAVVYNQNQGYLFFYPQKSLNLFLSNAALLPKVLF
jgi:hypothetical protein